MQQTTKDSGPQPAGKRGVALGMVFMLLFALVIAGTTVSYLMRSLQRQVEYADAAIRAQYIGESAYHRLFARLCLTPWDDRWFASGADTGSSVELHGGQYDYYIADNPNRDMHADIFVRAAYKGTRRSFYWLVNMEPSLLTGLAQGIVIGHQEIDSSTQPTTPAAQNTMAAAMEALITERQSKRPAAEAMGNAVQQKVDVADAIRSIGGTPPPGVVSAPFADSAEQVAPPTPSPVAPHPIPSPITPSTLAQSPVNEAVLDEEVTPQIVNNFDYFKDNLAHTGRTINNNLGSGQSPFWEVFPTTGSGPSWSPPGEGWWWFGGPGGGWPGGYGRFPHSGSHGGHGHYGKGLQHYGKPRGRR